MKKCYVCINGMDGNSAEAVTVVAAKNKKELREMGFKENRNNDIVGGYSIEEAEAFIFKCLYGFPKNRIKYWL